MCGEEEETFSYAILCCQSTSYHREPLVQDFSTLGPDSPLWSTKALLLTQAAWIRAAATGYPPHRFLSLPPSHASMVPPARQFHAPWAYFVSLHLMLSRFSPVTNPGIFHDK